MLVMNLSLSGREVILLLVTVTMSVHFINRIPREKPGKLHQFKEAAH